MPQEPGVLQLVEIDPTATHQNPDRTVAPATAYQVSSATWNPNYGLEAGRSGTPPTVVAAGGNDVL